MVSFFMFMDVDFIFYKEGLWNDDVSKPFNATVDIYIDDKGLGHYNCQSKKTNEKVKKQTLIYGMEVSNQ